MSVKPLWWTDPDVRFWANVHGGDPQDCWPWVGSKNRKGGYGTLSRGGKLMYAHRLSWEMHNGGPVPQGLCVCHSCDTPACVNPAHLWVGTHLDNAKDRIEKNFSHKLLDPATHCPHGWLLAAGHYADPCTHMSNKCRLCKREHKALTP